MSRPPGYRQSRLPRRDEALRRSSTEGWTPAARPGNARPRRWLVREVSRAAREVPFQGERAARNPPSEGAHARRCIAAFLESQDEVRAFLRTYAGIDLTGVPFPNPFIRGVRFSLATGLHVIAAHERRHLWQAWRVRQAAERSMIV